MDLAVGKSVGLKTNMISWEILWIEEPGGLQSMGSQRVGHNLASEQHKQDSDFKTLDCRHPV